jgi:hypothetical protein
MSEPTLVSSLLCEDVLPSSLIDGRVTIYRVLFDLSAARFPARSYRLFSANFWRGGRGEYADRTKIVTPSGLVSAEAEGMFIAVPQGHHVQIYRFDDLWLPEPGEYAVEVYRNDRMLLTYTLVVSAETSGDETSTTPAPVERSPSGDLRPGGQLRRPHQREG